jgi:hypothetical protein
MKHNILLLLLICVIGIQSVSAATVTHNLDSNLSVNRTTTIDTGQGVPSILWVGAIGLGFVLLILSIIIHTEDGGEGIISIMAWLPFALAMYWSLRVDVITNAGVVATSTGTQMLESHTIYQLNLVAMLLMIMLALSIGNTYRLWVSQKKMKELAEGPKSEMIDY